MPLRIRNHRCDFCDRLATWGEGWRWYGAVLDAEAGTIVKACPACDPTEADCAERVDARRVARYGTASARKLRHLV